MSATPPEIAALSPEKDAETEAAGGAVSRSHAMQCREFSFAATISCVKTRHHKASKQRDMVDATCGVEERVERVPPFVPPH
eukprot:3795052-Rhodomonas_salina.1